jgi:hypothetical protein
MLTTNIHSKACRYVLFTATMVFFASAQGAVARGGGSSGDHGMKSNEFDDHDSTERHSFV